MRWIWLDRILTLEKGKTCIAIRNVTAAEEQLNNHFPKTEDYKCMPLMPNSLVIEGMAQTAGILVGHAHYFAYKVILAKINKAEFFCNAKPGTTIKHTATIERLDATGGLTRGTTELINSATGESQPMAEINLMFSHIENNRQGLVFPEHNFVFSSQLQDLMHQSDIPFIQKTAEELNKDL